MGCLVQMASVRRTLFVTEDERQSYLANLMQMMIDVLKNRTGTCASHVQPKGSIVAHTCANTTHSPPPIRVRHSVCLLGMDQVDNHHEFSRLLYRFKSNYQLTQLVAVDKYNEWVSLVAEFTCSTFKAWEMVPNSGHNLLLMWSRLVSSMTYMKTDTHTLLDSLTPRVMEAFTNSMLESIGPDDDDEDGNAPP
jgi:exportin-7